MCDAFHTPKSGRVHQIIHYCFKKIIALMLSCYLKHTATEDVSDYVMKCEKPYFNITSKTRALYLVLFAS